MYLLFFCLEETFLCSKRKKCNGDNGAKSWQKFPIVIPESKLRNATQYLKKYLRKRMGCRMDMVHPAFKKIGKTSFKIRGYVNCSGSRRQTVLKVTGCSCAPTVERMFPFFLLFWGRYLTHKCNLSYRVVYLRVVLRLQ